MVLTFSACKKIGMSYLKPQTTKMPLDFLATISSFSKYKDLEIAVRLFVDQCILPELFVCIIREYYFSNENLIKDFFLRRQMDSDGWIPVELLASFRRVRIHTGSVNTQLIVEVTGAHHLTA